MQSIAERGSCILGGLLFFACVCIFNMRVLLESLESFSGLSAPDGVARKMLVWIEPDVSSVCFV